MPELPEVELAARFLRDTLIGRRLASAQATEPGRKPALDAVARFVGATLQAVRRKGKQLALDFDDGFTFLLHLGMTGRFEPWSAPDPLPTHARFVLVPDDGPGVVFCDLRRFGRFRIVPTAEADRASEWAGLGPDALEASLEAWTRALARRGIVKVVLLDQRRLAGVGNIYAGEGLWGAGIHPATPADRLDAAQVAALREAVVGAMQETLRREAGVPMRYLNESAMENPFQVYDRGGSPCPRCGQTIERITQAGRSTWFCPRCQPPSQPPLPAATRRRATSRPGSRGPSPRP